MALIYDVGMHTGEDTAFYLHQGHSVVGIEALPELAAISSERFKTEIATGRLRIINTAVDSENGIRPFWVCDDVIGWSSFNRSIASRDGSRHHMILVPTTRLDEIIHSFGLPFYLKIDVEGADATCLESLTIDRVDFPPYVSIEAECCGSDRPLSEDEYLAGLLQLRRSGYDLFKLVHQGSLAPVSKMKLGLLSGNYARRVREQIENDSGWTFPYGSSGPWGEAIDGPWMDFSEALEVYVDVRNDFFRGNALTSCYSFWYDWHAKRSRCPRSIRGF